MDQKIVYGRARVGQRANRIVGGQRGGNVSLIAAISDIAGMFYHETHTGGVNREIMLHFITNVDIILGDFHPEIIMDNAPCHNGIQALFPHRNMKYLPPYSPFLNPIEECFSVIKSRLKIMLNHDIENCNVGEARRRGMTLIALRENFLRTNIEAAVIVADPALCSTLYEHANSFLMKCLHNEDIWH